MVWKERSRVDERVLLIGEYLKGDRTMAELCRAFGVSRKTAYKWLGRYNEDGPSGLADRSRARSRILAVWSNSSSKRWLRRDARTRIGARARSWRGLSVSA